MPRAAAALAAAAQPAATGVVRVVLVTSFLPLVALGVLAIVALATWAESVHGRWDAEDRLRGAGFRAAPLLVNASERSAWILLNGSDLGQRHVFAKVRLEDVVSASARSARAFHAARGQIKSRHVDFLLTDADFRPVLAVEVDGGWHATRRAAVGDEVKNRALAAAGVPLLRLRVGDDWTAAIARWKGAPHHRARAVSALASRPGELPGGDRR